MLSPHRRPGQPHRSFGPPSLARLVILLVVVGWAIWFLMRQGG
jgi:hypothetical protein